MRTHFDGVRVFLIFVFLGIASSASARLGLTKAEWDAKFGKPDAEGVYRWEGPGGRARGGPFLMMIQVKGDRVTGIQVRRESGFAYALTPARHLIASLKLSDEDPVPLGDALSKDNKTITMLMPKEPEPSFTAPGSGMATKTTALMGKFSSDWIKAFGKADDSGFYQSGDYRLQTATNKNSGKVDWIKVLKVSGEAFTEEEAGRVYESLTGRKREEVTNPPSLHKEGTVLLMMKPKKSK